MEAHGRLRGERNLLFFGADAEVFEVCAEQLFDRGETFLGRQVEIFGANEIADAAALVRGVDLLPPLVSFVAGDGGLVEEHGRSGHQREEIVAATGDGRIHLPSGKNGDAAGTDRFLDGFFVADDTMSGKTRVNGGEQFFTNGRVGEREEHAFIDGAGGALRAGIELADGVDLVAKELDAKRTVGFAGIDVEDAAAQGVLAGHLDDISLGVADGVEVRSEFFGIDGLATAKDLGKIEVELGRLQAHERGVDRRDHQARFSGGDAPERTGTVFLNFGVRREILEGQHVVGGKMHDGVGREVAGDLGKSLDHRENCLGGAVVLDDQDERARSGFLQHAGEERFGRGSQSGDTYTPRGRLQVGGNTRKSRDTFHVRKKIADKRQDHPVLSVTVGLDGVM